MPKKDRFIEQLRRKQQAAVAGTPPPAKPVEQMSDAELEQELASTRAEERRLSEEAVRLSREGTAPRVAGRGFLWAKKRRPYWR